MRLERSAVVFNFAPPLVCGDPRLPARFWSKVVRSQFNGGPEHWIWIGATTSKGYGSFYLGTDRRGRQRTGVAHKMTYELAFGPLPKFRGVRTVIDHRCRQRGCVNPGHLEAVPEPVNVARGESPAARNARKTHCPKGHAYTPANTKIRKRGRSRKRYCRECRKGCK